MVDLVPAPATLGLNSPALGPWFVDPNSAPNPGPQIPIPAADLTCPMTFPAGMEVRAPAGLLVSWFIATPTRPDTLSGLRRPDGTAAFTNNSLVVLLTLLPEVAERLSALTNAVPRPDGGAGPDGDRPTRPALAQFAYEFNGTASTAMLQSFNGLYPPAANTPGLRASYLGLTLIGTNLSNAAQPATHLARPETSRAVIMVPGAGQNLNLWAFDTHGQAMDPGAVAELWRSLNQDVPFENLWASDVADFQRTAPVAAARVVHLVSASEGPLDAAIAARLTPTDLTPIGTSNTLYSVATTQSPAPALALAAAPNANQDNAPLARMAALPEGVYTPVAAATPFAGWTGGAVPLARDYLRVAVSDPERLLTGLNRASDAAQQHPHTRITAHQNDTPNAFLPDTDTVITEVMALLRDGDTEVIAPVMDADWGAQQAEGHGTATSQQLADLAPPAFEVVALAGEGNEAGDLAQNQMVALLFDGTLLPGAWIRAWTTQISAEDGARSRGNGGAGRADATGTAVVVLTLPDGTKGAGDGSVQLAIDLMLTAGASSRFFGSQLLARPSVAGGAQQDLPVPPGVSLFVPELGRAIIAGAGELRSGHTLLAVTGSLTDMNMARVNPATIQPADRHPDSLPNAAGAGDLLITSTPALTETSEGTLPRVANPGGPDRRHFARQGVTEVTTYANPVPMQERLELVGRDGANARAIIGGTPSRAAWHEANPPMLGHPGVTAATEIRGAGARLRGPAADALAFEMAAQASTTLGDYLNRVALPVTPAVTPNGGSGWAAILPTRDPGSVSDPIFRAVAAGNPTFQPGQSWLSLKGQIDSAITQVNTALGSSLGDVDSVIDTATFDDNQAALNVDRTIHFTAAGQSGLLDALGGAIRQAEDLIWIETPAIDALTTGAGPNTVDLIGLIQQRVTQRPNLSVVLVIPGEWLPHRPKMLRDIRKAAIKAAHDRLQTTAGRNVVLVTPVAGPERKLNMATTLATVDDTVLFVGTTHPWRRGLGFDSSLSVALTDDRTVAGRPRGISAARRGALARLLGVDPALLPGTAAELRNALQALNAAGGLGRVDPANFAPATDDTPVADQAIWNPDGRVATNWGGLFSALVNNGVVN